MWRALRCDGIPVRVQCMRSENHLTFRVRDGTKAIVHPFLNVPEQVADFIVILAYNRIDDTWVRRDAGCGVIRLAFENFKVVQHGIRRHADPIECRLIDKLRKQRDIGDQYRCGHQQDQHYRGDQDFRLNTHRKPKILPDDDGCSVYGPTSDILHAAHKQLATVATQELLSFRLDGLILVAFSPKVKQKNKRVFQQRIQRSRNTTLTEYFTITA